MSTTARFRRTRQPDSIGVVVFVLGLLLSLLAVLSTPTAAAAATVDPESTCETFGVRPPDGGYYRKGEHVVIDTDTSAFAGGTAVITDDNTPEPSVHPDNRMLVEVDGEQALEPFAYEIAPFTVSPEFTVGDRLTVTLQVARVTSIETLLVCFTAPEPEPEPEPEPVPGISLVKSTVVGDGSDLADGGEDDDFLSWAEDATEPQTARYRYDITNTGNEPLVGLELVDDRPAIGVIDLSDCPAVLAVDAGCTAFADETFERPDSAARVPNTGTVTGTGEGSGDTVSAEDVAAIELLVVLPEVIETIEIELVKSVVRGAGDVDAEGVVTWSQDDYEAGEAKTVVYRFEVTNVGQATIVDVELTDPMLGDAPIIAVDDEVSLEPGESTVVEVEYSLTVGLAFPDGQPIASEIDNVAVVSGANVTRDAFSEDSDDASVTTQVVFDEVVELPDAGLRGSLLLLVVGLLLAGSGAAVLRADRRRSGAA